MALAGLCALACARRHRSALRRTVFSYSPGAVTLTPVGPGHGRDRERVQSVYMIGPSSTRLHAARCRDPGGCGRRGCLNVGGPRHRGTLSKPGRGQENLLFGCRWSFGMFSLRLHEASYGAQEDTLTLCSE